MWLPKPCRPLGPHVPHSLRGPQCSARGKIVNRCLTLAALEGMHVGKFGPNGYITVAMLGIPNAHQHDKSSNGEGTDGISRAHTWAKRLHNPCGLGGSKCSRQTQNQIELHNPFRLGGPQTSSLGQNENWVPHPWLFKGPHLMSAKCLHNPCCNEKPNPCCLAVSKAHMWAKWLVHPCPLGDHRRSA